MASLSDKLNQFNSELREKLWEEIKKVFSNDEIYKYFADECEAELIKAHSDRTLALLGAVVVKDFIVPEEL